MHTTYQKVLLSLSILGTIAPIIIIGLIVKETGIFDFGLLLDDNLSSLYTIFAGTDLLITGIVFLTVYGMDWRRGAITKYPWLPLLATFSLGICSGFPIYLYLKSISTKV